MTTFDSAFYYFKWYNLGKDNDSMSRDFPASFVVQQYTPLQTCSEISLSSDLSKSIISQVLLD